MFAAVYFEIGLLVEDAGTSGTDKRLLGVGARGWCGCRGRCGARTHFDDAEVVGVLVEG